MGSLGFSALFTAIGGLFAAGATYGIHRVASWIGDLMHAAISKPEVGDVVVALLIVMSHVLLTVPVVVMIATATAAAVFWAYEEL